MPFIRVTPYLGEKTKRYIKTEHITAVIGPKETEKPIGPGQTKKTYDVEIQVAGNITHNVYCPSLDVAGALITLALSETPEEVETKQRAYDKISWEIPPGFKPPTTGQA